MHPDAGVKWPEVKFGCVFSVAVFCSATVVKWLPSSLDEPCSFLRPGGGFAVVFPVCSRGGEARSDAGSVQLAELQR